MTAAWAADAVATPFVQGRLRNQKLSAVIETECAHCARPISIELNSDLQLRVLSQGARPVLVSPAVNFDKLKDPSIIHAF